MGEQVGAGSKKKTSGKLVHIETDISKGVLSETERYKIKIERLVLTRSAGKCCYDNWFYQ